MFELLLLILGNSFVMFVANLVSIMIFTMMSWFVIENLYLPEHVRVAINEKSIGVPNWFIIQMYLFFCFLMILFM